MVAAGGKGDQPGKSSPRKIVAVDEFLGPGPKIALVSVSYVFFWEPFNQNNSGELEMESQASLTSFPGYFFIPETHMAHKPTNWAP